MTRYRFARANVALTMLAAEHLPLPSDTEPAFPIGFTVEAQIHPRGRPCTWFVEYGTTSSYGTTTSSRKLPPRRAAHYRETFDTDLSGFLGGISEDALTWQTGGYVRFAATGNDDDGNHVSGLRAAGYPNTGILWLTNYSHHGANESVGGLLPRMGGGFPDWRGARLSAKIRGNAWTPNGATLQTWIQSPNEADKWNIGVPNAQNWVHSGAGTIWDDAAAIGTWQTVEVTLRNTTTEWTYAGRNDEHAPPGRYFHGELDGCMWDGEPGGGGCLGNTGDDFFIAQCVDVGVTRPTGTLDFDDFRVDFPNHNVCLESNGGELVVAPPGGTGTEYLTDGWRNVGAGGAGEWQSASTPSFPLDFEYRLADPITLYAFMVHNSTANPSADIEIHVSENDGGAWTTIYTGTLPNGSNGNFNYCHAQNRAASGYFEPLHANPVNRVRVRVTSAVGARAGLGEIEFLGMGATYETENELHDVCRDITGLTPGTTYHYRVGYTIDGVTSYGSDQTVTVPPLAPTLSYCTPETMPATGGITNLYGANLATGTPTVELLDGGAPSAVVERARGKLRCTIGAHAVGQVDPNVTTSQGSTSRASLRVYGFSATTVERGAALTISGGGYANVTHGFVGSTPAALVVNGGGESVTLTLDPTTPLGAQSVVLWDPTARGGVLYFYNGGDPEIAPPTAGALEQATITVAEPYNPEARIWVEGPYTTAPWAGIDSAGISGSVDLAAGTAPGTSTLNGVSIADFNGTTHSLVNALTSASFVTNPYTILALVIVDTLQADSTPDSRPVILGSSNSGGWGLALSTSGVRLWHGTTLGQKVTGYTAISVATPTIIKARWDGSNLMVGKNSAAWGASVGSGVVSSMTGTLRVGMSSAGTRFDGKIAALMLGGLSDAEVTATIARWNTKFGLAL